MGKQKEARQNRLISEIYNFVCVNPGVNAAAIVGYLTVEVKMKNSGLTSRKIGYFISHHCKERVSFEEGDLGRTYFPIEKIKTEIVQQQTNNEKLEDKLDV